MPIRGRYSPFNLTAFNARLDHGSMLGLDDDDHGAIYIPYSSLASDVYTLDSASITLTAGALTANSITDGTLSISSGSITSGVAATFSGLGTFGDLLVYDNAGGSTRPLEWVNTGATNNYLKIGAAIEAGLIGGATIIKAIDGADDNLSLRASGDGGVSVGYASGTLGLFIYDGGTTNYMNLLPGIITDTSGTISFDNVNLTMGSATVNAGVFSMIQGAVESDPTFSITQSGDDVTINQTVGNMTITAGGGTIDFDNENITLGGATFGVNGTAADSKWWADTANEYMLWDAFTSTLEIKKTGLMFVGLDPTGDVVIDIGESADAGGFIEWRNTNAALRALIRGYDISGVQAYFTAGNVGFGVADPDTQVEILNAGTQLKLSYDASNFASFAVGATGNLTITADGGAIDFGNENLTTLGLLGIGTTAGTFLAHFYTETGVAYPISLTVSADSTPLPGFVGRSSRGTKASPTQTQEDDYLFAAAGRGYSSGGAFVSGSQAIFSIRAAEDVTDAAKGTYFRWDTIPIGSTTLAERMSLDENGLEVRSVDGGINQALRLQATGLSDGEGSYMEFATSTIAGYGPQILGVRTTAGAGYLMIKTGGNSQVDRMKITNAGLIQMGDGGATNYTQFSATGHQTMAGTATVWNDLQFQVSSARVPASNFPNWEAFTTNTYEYAFDVDEYAYLMANELHHSWKEGTAANIHLHLTNKTAQETGSNRYAKFTVYIAYADNDEVWAETSVPAELTIPTGTAAMTNFYLDMGDVALTNNLIGTQMKCTVYRIDATGGTEYADSVFITQVGVHLEEDSIGSNTEITK